MNTVELDIIVVGVGLITSSKIIIIMIIIIITIIIIIIIIIIIHELISKCSIMKSTSSLSMKLYIRYVTMSY